MLLFCMLQAYNKQTYEQVVYFVVYIADGSLTIENPNASAELGYATLAGAVAIEHQSVPRLESVKEITTAFTDESSLR